MICRSREAITARGIFDLKERAMQTIEEYILYCLENRAHTYVLSGATKTARYQKVKISKIGELYQCEQYTKTQVFHLNLKEEELKAYLLEMLGRSFTEAHAFDASYVYAIRISKKGKLLYNRTKHEKKAPVKMTHNRQKKYLLEEGTKVAPLVDMGVFTPEGKIIRSHYDKFRQINRFVELLEDELKSLDLTRRLHILDFGCGKSYLTFIVYYYLVYVRGLQVEITGLDLKEDVIKNCNEAACRYGYEHLHFEMGNIDGYACENPVDIVMTLHACDTATDFALYNAISWQAELILSVPCCQHELNKQMETDELSILTRYGIVKERTAALFTDAIRANLLISQGYDTKLLEFVDLSHTPKNLLIRAVRKNVSRQTREKAKTEVESLMQTFSLRPTLYELLYDTTDPTPQNQ